MDPITESAIHFFAAVHRSVELMVAASRHGGKVDLDECDRRLGTARARIMGLRVVPDQPQALRDFFAADDDKGCPACWEFPPEIHPECDVKMRRWYHAREKLILFGEIECADPSVLESELLLRINQGLPEDLSRRLEDLSAKCDAEILTDEEHAELLRLSDHAEQMEADRVKLLGELSRIRNRPLAAQERS